MRSGSSNGSGIAVECGFSSGSLGEDTGGSIRSPAAANGVVGLRPTFGRMSRYGGVMYGWTADTIGPITRSVEDNALFLQTIAGHDAADPLTSTRPVPDYASAMLRGVRGLRLAVVREMTWPDGVDPEVRSAMERAIEGLRELGAIISEISLKLAKHAVLPISLQIAAKPFDESTAFRVAYAYEQATPWHQRHPDLAAIAADGKRLTG